jgi:hypothetical protein
MITMLMEMMLLVVDLGAARRGWGVRLLVKLLLLLLLMVVEL